ncbi:PREDICTED: zinc finger protein 704 [Nanorana parkeri]|uniref:zinc finger protein 704 n=1 Tax=Nanorana parkeri TaxID=125878 RepID=UPI000854B7A0|nr:PREDICTED: zinc finger protein 704 [Nanorana parkeri]
MAPPVCQSKYVVFDLSDVKLYIKKRAKITCDKKNWEAKEQPVNIRRGHSTMDPKITEELNDASYMMLRSSSRIIEPEQEVSHECARSVCLLEQKRKVVSSNIDVPQTRRYEEIDMDKVTAAMVLTSLSTSPLVQSPAVQLTDVTGSCKETGCAPSSHGSSGCWSWSNTSDHSNPSTPSPPLFADNFKHFRSKAYPDDNADDTDTSNLLFEDPVPRKRKNSMKVMFKCLWKKCGKILSTAAGIKKHIRTIHLGRSGESDDCDGEEDFYYTEIRLNNDSGTEGLYNVSAVSPTNASAPSTIILPSAGSCETICTKTETKLNTRLSRSAPNTYYLMNSDHAYQATPLVNIPSSRRINVNNFSVSRPLPQTTFNGTSPDLNGRRLRLPPHRRYTTIGCIDKYKTPGTYTTSSDGVIFLYQNFCSNKVWKPRGEGKKCRKVYGMENRDKWCTACRWKKACQRFPD